jgi:hypothetical protein
LLLGTRPFSESVLATDCRSAIGLIFRSILPAHCRDWCG